MKKLIFLIAVFISVFAKGQLPEVPYYVQTIADMKSYSGYANRMHVVATNQDFVQCTICTADEVYIYAGVGARNVGTRKWKKVEDEAMWRIRGNTLLNRTTNYLGSSDTSQVHIKTKGINAIVIDSNQNVAVGMDKPGVFTEYYSDTSISKFTSSEISTNKEVSIAITADSRSARTANGFGENLAFYARAFPQINAGITQTGQVAGFYGEILRGYNDVPDEGTLSNLMGMRLLYGHGGNGIYSPVTANAYGIFLRPTTANGSITNLYDLYLGDTYTGTGTVTDHWGIYQIDPAIKSKLFGDLYLDKIKNAGGTYQVTVGTDGLLGSQAIPPAGWSLTGNTGVYGNYIGTNNNLSLRFRTNGIERLVIDSATGNTTLTTTGENVNAFTAMTDSGESRITVMTNYDKIPHQTGNNYPFFQLIRNNYLGAGVYKPAVVGDLLGRIGVRAPLNSAGTYNNDGALGMDVFATENWSSTASGSRIAFKATGLGTNTTYFPLDLNNDYNFHSAVTAVGNNQIADLFQVRKNAASAKIFNIDSSGQVTTGTVNGLAISTTTGNDNNIWLTRPPATYSNTLNSNSVYIGTGSGATITGTNSGDNVAVGFMTLRYNTTGVDHVAVGMSALQANTIGNHNTALGNIALLANTQGNDNVSVGWNSTTLNTVGSGNVAVGASSLNRTTGDRNIGVGLESLFSNTLGAGNIGIGYAAGYSLVGTGNDNNIFIGYGVAVNNTAGSNNIAIGKLATLSSLTASNELNLGGIVYGVNTYNLATSRMGLGVVTPAASAKLDVTSTTQGVLLPRMTKAQRDAISSPATGLTIWQTDNTPGLRSYNGTNWMRYTETTD